MIRALFLGLGLFGIAPLLYAESPSNPCGDNFLNLVDRPTAADSVCVVPLKKAVVELGTQYQQLTQSNGNQVNLPQAVLRFGIPLDNELVLNVPNYSYQTQDQPSGFNSPVIGIKHQLAFSTKWVATVESLFTLPAGSPELGNANLGVAVNGIINYNLTPKLGLSFMIGASDQSEAKANGGKRYTSINPDWVLSYALQDKLSLYGEFYGQSKTAPNEGRGFNADCGLIYLYKPNITFDIEFGQRVNGSLGGFEHYAGAGMAMLF